MPADVPVLGLVVWRNSQEHPVGDAPDGEAWTDQGCWNVTDYDFQPSWWCAPSPPDMNDPLTVEDLCVAAAALECQELSARGMGWDGVAERMRVRAARLRRALDALPKEEDDA